MRTEVGTNRSIRGFSSGQRRALDRLFEQYAQILSATSDDLNEGWSFVLMLDQKAFISFPKSLEVERQKMPVIKTSRKPTCWKCGETGHLFLLRDKSLRNSGSCRSKSPFDRVYYFHLTCDGHANDCDRCGHPHTPIGPMRSPHFPKSLHHPLVRSRRRKRRNSWPLAWLEESSRQRDLSTRKMCAMKIW